MQDLTSTIRYAGTMKKYKEPLSVDNQHLHIKIKILNHTLDSVSQQFNKVHIIKRQNDILILLLNILEIRNKILNNIAQFLIFKGTIFKFLVLKTYFECILLNNKRYKLVFCLLLCKQELNTWYQEFKTWWNTLSISELIWKRLELMFLFII